MKLRSIITAIGFSIFCLGSAHAQSLKVGLGTDGFVHLPLFVAYDAGLFKDEGLDVELVKFKGGGAAMSGLVGNSVDICSCSVQNAINATEKGAPVVLIGALIDQYASNVILTEEAAKRVGLTREMSTADRLKALKGLKIAAAGAGGSADFLVRHLAGAAGLSPERDMTLLYMNDSGAMLASFDRNRIDGFALSSPTSDIAILNHKGQSLFDMAAGEYEPLAGYPSIAISTRKAWLEENGETAVKFLKVITKADRMIHDDPEKAKAAIRQRFSSSNDDVFEAAWKANLNTYPENPSISAATVERVMDFLGSIRGEKIPGKPSDYFDETFANEAIKQLSN